jgi:hypothetical protein
VHSQRADIRNLNTLGMLLLLQHPLRNMARVERKRLDQRAPYIAFLGVWCLQLDMARGSLCRAHSLMPSRATAEAEPTAGNGFVHLKSSARMSADTSWYHQFTPQMSCESACIAAVLPAVGQKAHDAASREGLR